MRSANRAAHTSRGLGRVMTKQMERPGCQVPLASSSCSCSRLCSAWASNACALALLRLWRRQSSQACTSKPNRCGSAEGNSRALVALVVVVLVAVVEVAIPGVGGATVALCRPPCRRPEPISKGAAPDAPRAGAAVSVVCLSVGLWPSGATRFTVRTGMRALTVILLAPCSWRT
ncbi:hypothetical protein D3C71_1287710 [compost metagenome]